METEFKIPLPRSATVLRVLYNPDAEIITCAQAFDNTDYVNIDLDGLFVDEGAFGTLTPRIVPLESYLLTQCKILHDIDNDDCSEYDDYVSQHSLNGQQLGV